MSLSEREMILLAERLGERLRERGWKLAVAESCTGGWLGKVMTSVPGSSGWFTASLVTYGNDAKQALLGVPAQTLADFGAVSEQTVAAMTAGVFDALDVDLAVSISGIAGPGGGTPDKPVGLVWLAGGRRGEVVTTQACHFDGDRESVRAQAVEQTLQLLLRLADESAG